MATALKDYAHIIEEAKKISPLYSKLKNTDLAEFGWTWIDDGKNDRVEMKIINDNLVFTIKKK